MLSLITGQGYRRMANSPQRGPEYHGPCPVCGGNDRFHVWPEQKGGTFWCRGCGKQGDLVEFYRWKDGLGYRDACARAGVDARTYAPQSAPAMPRHSGQSAFVPARTVPVPSIWAAHAEKFALWCHEQLLANEQQQAWLAKRGIESAMIAKYTLGWNPADAYRTREAWGLETIRHEGGKPKKLWLPQGLVIPQWLNHQVARLRIRRPNPEPGQAKYYVVPGSGREPLISSLEKQAYVVVESELDGILLDGKAGDLVGVVAMGNASAKPTETCHALLSRALHLSISLDSDAPRHNPATGKTESAGAQGSLWWLKQYRTAVRVPVIGGKDPGDAFQAGVDLRAWVLAGLPPRFHIAAQQPAVSVPPPHPTVPAQQQEPAINHRILTLASGQEIHVVDNQQAWEQLVAEGEIVFSENELNRLQASLVGLEGEERTAAVQAVIDAKAVFPGAYVHRGEIATNP